MWIICVHVGCGRFSRETDSLCNTMKKACFAAAAEFAKSYPAGELVLNAASKAVMVLENDPLTNAGLGSNLTAEGVVECDACIVGCVPKPALPVVGSCAAVAGVRNPILLAGELARNQLTAVSRILGRTPVLPVMLCGEGACAHARKLGLQCASTDSERSEFLVTARSRQSFFHNSKLLQKIRVSPEEGGGRLFADQHQDTVGAVCLFMDRALASAVSSGGIAMKPPGRVGEAALIGCG
eukprot:RCo000505